MCEEPSIPPACKSLTSDSLTRLTAHDVLAITLRAILYYLCKNPTARQRLYEEILNADVSGGLSKPARYAEVAKLSYLYAFHRPVMSAQKSRANVRVTRFAGPP